MGPSGSPPSRPRRHHRCRRRRGWLVLLAIGLLALGIIGLRAGSGGSTSAAATSTPAAAQATATAPAEAGPTATPAPACIRPCANVNGWIAQASNLLYDLASGNEFEMPEVGNVYVAVDVMACWGPVSRLTRIVTALAGAVAGVAGLLSALVAAGIIHAAPAPAPPATLRATPAVAFVVYSSEGLRLQLGQCFDLDTGLAQCGEEDIALPQRLAGVLAISNGAEVSVLGVRSLADYSALDAAELQSLSYSSVRTIPLEAGLLLAVKTHSGNYAKVWLLIVQTPDYTLKMKTCRVG